MKGWQVFAAIVIAVTAPVLSGLIVYRTCVWLSYDAADILMLLKCVVFGVIGVLCGAAVVTFCLGLSRD